MLIETINELKGKKVFFGTKDNLIKMVDGELFDVTRKTSQATKLGDNDEVIIVQIINPDDTVAVYSENGYFLRFQAADVPEKKKAALGVRGMNTKTGEDIVGIAILKPGDEKAVKVGKNEVHLERLHIAARNQRGTKR